MKWLFPPLLALTMLAGCTSPGYFTVNPTVVHARRIVEPDIVFGVPFYQGGGPAEKYRVIGYINGSWEYPYLEEADLKRLAKTVRAAHGRGAVVVRGPGALPGGVGSHPKYDDFTLRVQIIE
jgi:hypothetical protein